MTCPICFDDMDMQPYQDEREGTETCHKLECGHAFHTKCVVNFLTRTNHKCPSCNEYKPPETELEMEGVIMKLIRMIQKDDDVKIASHEYKTIKEEYRSALTQLKADTKKYAQERARELKLAEHKSYYKKCKTELKRSAMEAARQLGNKYVAAAKTMKHGVTFIEYILFGKRRWSRDWRFMNPGFYITI